MRRLYFLVPNLVKIKNIIKELQAEGISEEDIYIIGKNHHSLEVAHLREAGIIQTTDFLPALIKGILVGGMMGFFIGISIVNFFLRHLILGKETIIALTIFGAGFGAWTSTLIGVSVTKPLLLKFEKAIERGELLMLVDVPKIRENRIITLIQIQHPEVKVEGISL